MHLPKDRKGRVRLAAIVAGVVVVYFLYRSFFPEFDVQQLLADISSTLGKWTYLLVFALAFLETGAFVGLVAPGETIVVLGGAVAGQGETSVLLTIALAWGGAFLGDTASFFLGAKLGRGFVLEHGNRVKLTRERLEQVEGYFDRHGGKTILIGRFIGVVRALAPFIAGSSGMTYSRMAPFSILGTGLWASFFTLLGYFASQNLDAVIHAAEQGFLYFGLMVALVVGIIVTVRYLRVAENRAKVEEEMRERAWLRPLLRLGPQVRFLWERLTPGGLGLELTGPAAALAVGGFVFIAFALIVGDDPGPTAGDTEAIDFVGGIRSDWLTSVCKAITALGSPVALVIVSAVAATVFGVRRHWVEFGILVGAVILLLIAVPEFKALIDRPRQTGALIGAGGQSYPSGHAAYSVVYAWLAIAATVRLRPGWSGGTALLVAGILLTVAIGLTRVYLGVHFMSDVSGGWGLGVCAFALATVAAVIVSHIRHNPEPDEH